MRRKQIVRSTIYLFKEYYLFIKEYYLEIDMNAA